MNILLVEDDINMGRGVKNLLEINGFNTDWAHDGKEALEYIGASKQHTYDVILLDWMLPELSGIEVCKTIRHPQKGNFQGGVIFLTAKSGLDDSRRDNRNCGRNGSGRKIGHDDAKSGLDSFGVAIRC